MVFLRYTLLKNFFCFLKDLLYESVDPMPGPLDIKGLSPVSLSKLLNSTFFSVELMYLISITLDYVVLSLSLFFELIL